ncbi:MAG: hypothetical protein BJ554DRAFT_5214, partial [Olpidium bornovanus]
TPLPLLAPFPASLSAIIIPTPPHPPFPRLVRPKRSPQSPRLSFSAFPPGVPMRTPVPVSVVLCCLSAVAAAAPVFSGLNPPSASRGELDGAPPPLLSAVYEEQGAEAQEDLDDVRLQYHNAVVDFLDWLDGETTPMLPYSEDDNDMKQTAENDPYGWAGPPVDEYQRGPLEVVNTPVSGSPDDPGDPDGWAVPPVGQRQRGPLAAENPFVSGSPGDPDDPYGWAGPPRQPGRSGEEEIPRGDGKHRRRKPRRFSNVEMLRDDGKHRTSSLDDPATRKGDWTAAEIAVACGPYGPAAGLCRTSSLRPLTGSLVGGGSDGTAGWPGEAPRLTAPYDYADDQHQADMRARAEPGWPAKDFRTLESDYAYRDAQAGVSGFRLARDERAGYSGLPSEASAGTDSANAEALAGIGGFPLTPDNRSGWSPNGLIILSDSEDDGYQSNPRSGGTGGN